VEFWFSPNIVVTSVLLAWFPCHSLRGPNRSDIALLADYLSVTNASLRLPIHYTLSTVTAQMVDNYALTTDSTLPATVNAISSIYFCGAGTFVGYLKGNGAWFDECRMQYVNS